MRFDDTDDRDSVKNIAGLNLPKASHVDDNLIYFDESVENFRQLAEDISDVLWMTDLNFNTTYISPAITRYTGDSVESYKAKPLEQKLPPSSIEKMKKLLADELRKEEDPSVPKDRSLMVELEYYKADGSTIWTSAHVTLKRDTTGKLIGFQGVTRDISAIKETQRTYRDILNTMSEAIYVQDQSGTFLEVNEGAARMYQCQREDLLGKNPADVSAPGMNDLDMIRSLSANVWETGNPVSFEFWALRCTGEIFLKEVIVNKGKYFGQDVLLATARDITDRKESERKLRESEELHRVLLMTVPDLIVRTDASGNVVFINEVSLGAELQLQKDLVIGKNMLSFIAPEDLERARENTRLMFDGPLGPQEYRLISPHGESIFCEINGEVLRDGKHQPIGMVYVIRNITDRRLADEKLREANKMFQLVIDNIPQYVFWKDRDSRFLGCNDNIAHAAGLDSPADLIGKTDYEMPWSKEEADFYVECDRRVMSTGIPEYHIIEPQTRADGKLAWLDTNKVPLVDDKGCIVGILGTFEDITERIKADNELKLEARLRQLLVEISSAYINAPLDSIQAEIQSSMRKIAEFVEADRCYIFDADPGKETYSNTYEWCAEGIDAHIAHLQNIPIPIEWNDAFVRSEAVYVPDLADLPTGYARDILEPQGIRSLISFPMLHQGECLGFVGFDSVTRTHEYSEMEQQLLQVYAQLLVNIRLRSSKEEELIQARDRAEESDRLKSAFLANMSHEIRTPMNGILGFASLLKEPNLSGEEQKEFIELIETSGMRMLNIINDIINISKIEAGLMKAIRRDTDVNAQLEYIHAFFKPEADLKRLALKVIAPLTGADAIIYTDPEKLYAILFNLVKNAVKYSRHGSIEISYTPQDKHLLFQVRDEGIGIPPDKFDSIFERFIQADITDARPYEGAGLGLSIAKAYVEMLGGKIWVQSTLGKGSSFFFTLPYERDSVGENQSKTDQSAEKAFGARKLRVLIVEDDQVSYWLLQRMLRGIAKDILRASNGDDAIRLARENPDLDLILMDIKMPGMNGHETTRKIREFNPRIPIIAQTAHGFSGDREEALRHGCTDYILKPVEKNDLYAMIREYLEM